MVVTNVHEETELVYMLNSGLKHEIESEFGKGRAVDAVTLSTKKERANDYLVAAEKRRILESNREEVRHVYRARFASREEADRMWVVC